DEPAHGRGPLPRRPQRERPDDVEAPPAPPAAPGERAEAPLAALRVHAPGIRRDDVPRRGGVRLDPRAADPGRSWRSDVPRAERGARARLPGARSSFAARAHVDRADAPEPVDPRRAPSES